MRALRSVLAVFLCCVLVISSLLLLSSLFLRRLVFSVDFYADVIAAPAYQPMVRNAILDDLDRQGRYVDIPLEVLAAGLDDSYIYQMQRRHIENLAAFLNYRADFVRPVYPADRFREPLLGFIEAFAAEQDFEVTAEQIELLEEVAADSAAIVQLHTTLIDLTQVIRSSAFQSGHRLVYDLSHRLGLALIFWLAAWLGLILLRVRAWRVWLHQVLVSFWLCGSLLLVPTLVLDRFALHRRLALETPYLRYAVSRLLQSMIQFFMVWGTGLFVVASISLIVLFLTRPDAGRKKAAARPDRVQMWTD